MKLSREALHQCIENYLETGSKETLELIVMHHHERIDRCIRAVLCKGDESLYNDIYNECVENIVRHLSPDGGSKKNLLYIAFNTYMSLKYQITLNFHSCMKIYHNLSKTSFLTSRDIRKISDKYDVPEYTVVIMFNMIHDNNIKLDYDSYDELEPEDDIVYDGTDIGDMTYSPETIISDHQKDVFIENLCKSAKAVDYKMYCILSGKLKYKDVKDRSYFKLKQDERNFVARMQHKFDKNSILL